MIGAPMSQAPKRTSQAPQRTSQVLKQWNSLPAVAAAADLLSCCGSQAWAREMARRRPLVNVDELLAASDAAWRACGEADRREAFACHPRLGETLPPAGESQPPAGDRQPETFDGHAGRGPTQRSLAWSGEEQSAVAADSDHAVAERLAEANRAYEAKFGMIFLVFANGRGGAEILRLLEERMSHDADREWTEAGEQQRQITALRLRRWMEAR